MLQDLELRKGSESPAPPEPERRPLGLWIALGVLLVGIAAAAYVVFVGRSAPSGPAAGSGSPPPAGAPSRPQPLGSDAEAVDLPPLTETDPIVRELVRRVSSHPSVAAWLATDNLIRTFTVAVANVAEGRTPSRHLAALRPPTAFRVLERDGSLVIDPRSYARYDALAAAAASLDPAGTARLYTTLRPRIEDAWRELGAPDTPFDSVLERAIVMLLRTPVVDERVRVEPRGVGFAHVDPQLEGLTSAQKHLLRTGPRNVRTFQSSLREIALALGIPAERLPAPR